VVDQVLDGLRNIERKRGRESFLDLSISAISSAPT